MSIERTPEELLPPRALATTIKVIDSFGDWVGTIVGFLVVLLIIAGVYEVLGRYFFNAPTIWAHSSSLMLVGSMIMLRAGYTLLKNNMYAPTSSTFVGPYVCRGSLTAPYT